MREKRLVEIERKLEACLILLLKIMIADDLTYNLMDKSPKWIRAMSTAEHLASRVSLDAANRHPRCASEEMADLLLSLRRSDTFPSANETAVSHTGQMDVEHLCRQAVDSSPSEYSQSQEFRLDLNIHREPKIA